VGINPGLWTAATQTHFCHPSNRFYPALRVAGLIRWGLESRTGMTADQRQDLVSRGIGITNLVPRATARASEISARELRDGAAGLRSRVRAWAPAVVAVAGVTAYRTAFGVPNSGLGHQSDPIEGADLWVIPNPSGLNAHVTVSGMADWLAQVAREAGIASS
jgi:TDG/mug DNA glycosylase family protein